MERDERGLQGRRQHVFVSVYSCSHSPPSHAHLLGRVRPGGQPGPRLSSSSILTPGTAGLCWSWTGGRSMVLLGTVGLAPGCWQDRSIVHLSSAGTVGPCWP